MKTLGREKNYKFKLNGKKINVKCLVNDEILTKNVKIIDLNNDEDDINFIIENDHHIQTIASITYRNDYIFLNDTTYQCVA